MYNILVVDDEIRIRSLIRKYAEFEGHTVTEAGDGMEAVHLCRVNTYDIIIMDIADRADINRNAGTGWIFCLP